MKVILTPSQRKQLEKLWFVYGNMGKKHSHHNHKFIQAFIEQEEDSREFYLSSPRNDLTQECIEQVDKILGNENS